MNRLKKWIIERLGGVERAELEAVKAEIETHRARSAIQLTRTAVKPLTVNVIINTPESDMKHEHYNEWEKDRAARGIGYEIISNGLFKRLEFYNAESNTMQIKYSVNVLERGENHG